MGLRLRQARAVSRAKSAPDGAGDAWTFTAIDAQSKLIVSYLVSGDRDGQSAIAFMTICADGWRIARKSRRTA